jgi:hypothetical protein
MAGNGDGFDAGGESSDHGKRGEHYCGRSAKPEVKIGFWEYFRVGLPITVTTLIVGWAWPEWVK